jgi:MFS family permease
VHEAWQAVALGAVLGTAAGGWLTGQSVLLAAIVPPHLRHVAFAQQRVAANLGLGLGGLAGGLIASTTDPRTFTVLFLLNAITFAAYGCFIAFVRVPVETTQERPRGYGVVLRDPILRRVLAIDFAVVAAAVALVNGMLPVYAHNDAGIAEKGIGVLFLVNSLLIIGAQLPVARAVEGHSRARMLALMAACFALCWVLVLGRSYAFLLAGVCVLSLGECLYDSVRSPLVADLAPPGLGGRYLASAGFSWQLGFVAGPMAGAALLGVSPYLLWPSAAAVCAAAAVAALALPPEVGITARRR